VEWTAKQRNLYNKTVTKAKRLYNSAQAGWVDFVLYLSEIEDKGLWKNPEKGFNGFSDFLREEFPAAWGIERYNNAKKAMRAYGVEFMKRTGIECAHAITIDAMFEDPAYVPRLIKECEDHFAENGVMPDINTIRDYVYKITRVSRPVSRRSEQRRREQELRRELSQFKKTHAKAEKAANVVDKLKEENQRLKAELRAAKARIRELENELSQFKKARERSNGARRAGSARVSKRSAARA